ncbi:MAG: N-acetylmuramoyl-L-alanine amidase [Acidobacteriota bacterium]
MSWQISNRFLIPRATGHAVDRGWTAATDHEPVAITWHWSATATLAECSNLLGGSTPLRRGVASAHYAVGRSYAEGVDRYVGLEDRSWHAGKNQTLRWDGRPYRSADDKGARTSIGIETINLGYARPGLPAGRDWLRADSTDGRWRMRIQPWTDEQITMMIAVGQEVVARWPNIGPSDHHGHHDICPGYKVDPLAFPFAQLLRGIYDDPSIPDVWTPFWTARGRIRALRDLGYDPGPAGAGGRWDERCDQALRRLQRDMDLVPDGRWSTFVCWRVHDALPDDPRA